MLSCWSRKIFEPFLPLCNAMRKGSEDVVPSRMIRLAAIMLSLREVVLLTCASVSVRLEVDESEDADLKKGAAVKRKLHANWLFSGLIIFVSEPFSFLTFRSNKIFRSVR